MNLPPLPEPSFRLRWSGAQGRYTVSTPDIDSQDCYSAEAVRAYAAEAVRVALAAAAKECERMRRETLQLKAYEQAASYANARDAVFALIPKD